MRVAGTIDRNQQIKRLTKALGLADALNRTLILPLFQEGLLLLSTSAATVPSIRALLSAQRNREGGRGWGERQGETEAGRRIGEAGRQGGRESEGGSERERESERECVRE